MIFVDVGAHNGQTLEEVIKPKYSFDAIYAFEPMKAQFNNLKHRYQGIENLYLVNAGLLDDDVRLPIFGNNQNMEASIYSDKKDVDSSLVEQCDFINAGLFVAQLKGKVIMKVNCEGSEVRLIRSLMTHEVLGKIHNILIDFDVRKIPSMADEEIKVLAELATLNFHNYCLAEDVMIGPTHQERIENWLTTVFGR